MSHAEDLTGRQFGELTAIAQTDRRSNHSVVWLCRCSCGNMVYVSASNLKSGNQKSCGHLRRKGKDITGVRRGRLTAVHPLRLGTKNISWLLRCDCGGVRIAPLSAFTASHIRSCGCVRKEMYGDRYRVTCPACGMTYLAESIDDPIPQFCPDCAPKYAGRAWKVCPVCKKLFPDPPSNNRVTCSKSCSAKWRASLREGAPHPWSPDAKGRLSVKGQTDNLKLGTAAAKKSPVAGRFETNQEAKIWTLIDPSGRETTVKNLLLWAREHTELFDKPPGDKSALQIAHGFQAIAATLRGVRGAEGKPRGAMTYFGWTLKRLPEPPPD